MIRANCMSKKCVFLAVPLAFAATALTGCSSVGASGPSASSVMHASERTIDESGIKVVDVTDAVARQQVVANRAPLFSQLLGDGTAETTIFGPGDVLDISIIEAPPAVLYSGAIASAQLAGSVRPTTVSSGLQLPSQMIDSDGRINTGDGTYSAADRIRNQAETAGIGS